jgi:hypothetical protein
MTRVPLGISARPFDFFVAFLVFFVGLYGFLDPSWPPEGDLGSGYYILMIEDLYLVVAGVMIMLALIVKQLGLSKRFKVKVKPRIVVSAIIGEMFGWLFVSAAATVIAVTAWILPPTALSFDPDLTWIWFALWTGLAASAGARFRDMRNVYKHVRTDD